MNIRCRRSRRLAASVAGMMVVSLLYVGSASAEQDAATGETVGPNQGRLSFSLSDDFTTAYFFRGILQERHGFIWEPSAELGLNVYEGDGALASVDLGVGVWMSYHERETLSDGNGAAPLYEADYYPSVTLGWSVGLETSLTYYFYTSPNGAWDTVEEIELELAYDDSELLGDFALSPYAKFAFETLRTSFGTPKKGGYFEFGVEPGMDFTCPHDEAGRYPVTLSLPALLGLSMYHYYDDGVDDDTFGFASLGVKASLPLAFIPADFGSWSLSSGVNVLFLNDTLEEENDGDEVFAVWTSNISMDY